MNPTLNQRPKDPAIPADPKRRGRRSVGGARLGQQAGPQAQRLAAAILEVLAGERTPGQAAEALGLSLPRYFQVEARALDGLIAACAPRPRGPGRSIDRELAALKQQHERLQRQLQRQQALVRLAQRTIGLAPAKAAAGPPAGPGKRRRRPAVRALRVADRLRRQEMGNSEEGPAAAAPLSSVEA